MSVADASSEVKEFSWAELRACCLGKVVNCDLSSEIQIPALPAALMEFMKAADDPNVEIRHLGKIIQTDPGLTIDLLKCVNVAFYASRNPARNATEALMRMGIRNAKTYLIAMGTKSSMLSYDSKLMNHQNFWNESMQKALFAQNAAGLLQTDKGFAFMAGLLQDFILPFLTNQRDDEYIEYLRGDAGDGVPLHEWEMERFGFSHAMAGAFVASKWNLSDDLLCAIYLHHEVAMPSIVPAADAFSMFPATLAALLPDQLRQSPKGMERLLKADEQSKAFNLDSLCEQVDEELETIAEGRDRPNCLLPAVEAARAAQVK